MKLLELPDDLKNRRMFGFFDDFEWYVTAHRFTSVLSNSGTIAVGDAAGGIVTLTPSDGTVADNDEAYLKSTAEMFLFANEKPLLYEVRQKFVEANTDDANVAHGFMNAVAADSILDTGGGPAASFSGAVLYKVDGGTVWRFRTSVGTDYVDTVTRHTAGGSSYQTLRIEIRQGSAGAGGLEAVPFLDGVQMQDANYKPIKHAITYTSATEMNAFSGVKNGDTNLETLLLDYMAAYQLR